MNHSIGCRAALLAALLLTIGGRAVAAITEISIPTGSQIVSRPLIDNVWQVASQGGTLSTTQGIGIVVKPTWISADDNTDFSLHQNDDMGSQPYVAAHVPPAAASTVTYKFDRPTVVGGVEIVQHVNGITQVSGLADATSIGTVYGPSGDVTSGYVVPADGVSQVFNFANSSVAGTTFKLTVTKSSHPNAFAVHRIFLLDVAGVRIPTAGGPTTTGPVGAIVTGLAGQKQVTCRNVTTGQVVTFTQSAQSWNCEARGLVVKKADYIEQIVRASK